MPAAKDQKKTEPALEGGWFRRPGRQLGDSGGNVDDDRRFAVQIIFILWLLDSVFGQSLFFFLQISGGKKSLGEFGREVSRLPAQFPERAISHLPPMAAATPWDAAFCGLFGEVRQSLADHIVATEDWLSVRFREFVPDLWVAAARGNPQRVRRLLAGGADVEKKGGLSQTSPLFAAARMGTIFTIASAESYARHEEVVLLLLQHSADVSAADVFGRTALHVSSWQGHEAVVLLLLQHGADVSSKTKLGSSPLHMAALKGHKQVILTLLEHGADVSSTDLVGQTPEGLATSHSHLQAAAMLKAEAVSRAKCVAFAMGLLGRLGAESWVHALDAEMVRKVLEQV